MGRAIELPFVVSTCLWEARPGQHNLTVCLKATFTFDREPRLAAPQDGSHDDVFWDQTPGASLYSPSDYAPFKPRADVLLVGHAYAPGGAPVEALTARLAVGDWSKSLRVLGERQWVRAPEGPRPSAAHPFLSMPLRYERATKRGDNMVGATPLDTSRPPPNLDLEGSGETPGFAPIAPGWRLAKVPLSPDAASWVQKLRATGGQGPHPSAAGQRGRTGPAPAGLDFAFFNAAPRDQQLEGLAPGALLFLENLTARAPRLELRLPMLAPTVYYVDPSTGKHTLVAARCDTLWIDTDREVFALSWRGVTPLAAPNEKGIGKLVYGASLPSEPMTFQEIEHRLFPGVRPPSGAELRRHAPAVEPQPQGVFVGSTGVMTDSPLRPALPFKAPSAARTSHVTAPLPAFAGTVPLAAPYPLAEPGADRGESLEEIPGAPWTASPGPVVLRPTPDMIETMALERSPFADPPAPPAEVPTPPFSPQAESAPEPISPTPLLDDPTEEVSAMPPAAPSGSPWREDAAAPTPPPAPATPPPAAPAPAVKAGVYGGFGRPKP